jgi:prepilin-type N-terminal cleavage/methylation domain-containing protein
MKKAFTLIELMIVIAVIAILSTIALIGFRGVQDAARDSNRLATIRSLQNALERYFSDTSGYPVTTDATLVATGLVASNYMPIYTVTGVSTAGIAACGAATTRPCYQYNGAAAGYTISFFKSSGGVATVVNPILN